MIIPVLDAEATLGEQLEALSRQVYEGPWELVIVDNGCKDASIEIAESYDSHVPSLRIVGARSIRGINHARNAGVRAARGRFFMFCDADDLVGDGWLAAMAHAAAHHDLIGGFVDDKLLNDPLTKAWRPAPPHEGFRGEGGFLPYPFGCNCGISKKAFAHVGGWNEDYNVGGGDEVELFWRAQLLGYELHYVSDAVVNYRYRSGLRTLARQYYGYGQASAQLFKDFRAHGMPTKRPISSLKAWGWIASRSVSRLLASEKRGIWIRKTCFRLGMLRGSVRHKVFYL